MEFLQGNEERDVLKNLLRSRNNCGHYERCSENLVCNVYKIFIAGLFYETLY
jgi:hypothetical protein